MTVRQPPRAMSADVVAEPVAGEEEGDPEQGHPGAGRWCSRTKLADSDRGRVDPEGERLFGQHKKLVFKVWRMKVRQQLKMARRMSSR